jgi:adenine deaminase
MGYRGFSKVNATTVKALRDRIFAARRQIPADLVLKEARVVNVFSGGIQERDVAVFDGIIVGVGSDYHGKNEVHLKGKYVVPGLIDGHFHIESSMLLPSNLAAALLIHGTTTIVTDPHEIANVMGMDGIRFMLEESRLVPLAPLVSQLRAVKSAAHSIGCALEEPFMSLSFLALPVIPELKLTDRGLVDVNNSKIVPLFLGRR